MAVAVGAAQSECVAGHAHLRTQVTIANVARDEVVIHEGSNRGLEPEIAALGNRAARQITTNGGWEICHFV